MAGVNGVKAGKSNRKIAPSSPLKRKEISVAPTYDFADVNQLLARKSKVEKRLVEISGPPLPKKNFSQKVKTPQECHWDHLLKEVQWLSADVAKERMRHIGHGKKLSKAVESYHLSKGRRKAKQAKDVIIQNKRIASKISKDVMQFWMKINKVIAFKQKSESDEARQKAMDKHLDYLVKQTERYTGLLASNLESGGSIGMKIKRNANSQQHRDSNNRHVIVETASSTLCADNVKNNRNFDKSLNSKNKDEDKGDGEVEDQGEDEGEVEDEDEDDEDFVGDDEADDETTLIEAEKEAQGQSTADELAKLREEGEMSIDELRAQYAAMDDGRDSDDSDNETMQDSDDGSRSLRRAARLQPKRGVMEAGTDEDEGEDEVEVEDEDDEDFVGDDEADDETTLIEAEKEAQGQSTADELAKLREEGEMSIDELRAMYAAMDDGRDSDDSDNETMQDSDDGSRSLRRAARLQPKRGVMEAGTDEDEGEDEVEVEDEDDDDFVGDDEADDETTLIEAEKEAQGQSTADELAKLREEGEMSIDELRAKYAAMDDGRDSDDSDNETMQDSDDGSRSLRRAARLQPKRGVMEAGTDEDEGEDEVEVEDEDDEDFVGDDEADDETTLIEAEKEAQGQSTADELAKLREEGEMSIDELRAQYAAMDDGRDSDDSDNETMQDSDDGSRSLRRAARLQPKRGVMEAGTDEDEGEDEVEVEDEDDDDFVGDDEADDETTLIEAEKEAQGQSTADELAKLREEGEMSIDELRAQYAAMDDGRDSDDSDNETMQDSDDGSRSLRRAARLQPKRGVMEAGTDEDEGEDEVEVEDEDDEDFVGDDEADDETTLIEAEKEAQGQSTADELAKLREEGEMSIDELRAKYAAMDDGRDSDDSDNETMQDSDDGSRSLRRAARLQPKRGVMEAGTDEDEGEDEVEVEDEDDEDFVGDDEADDETTLIEAEKEAQGQSTADELAKLREEGEMSIDELRAKYAAMDDGRDSDDSDGDITNLKSSPHAIDEGNDSNIDNAMVRLEKADLRARSIHVELPFILSRSLSLREYQHVGLNWLVSLHERRLNGILADEMGLGKTIQTIALLAYLAVFRGIWGPHLIVVPTSCLINWEMEFKKWCPAFKVLTYYGSAKARKNLRIGWSKLNAFQVCITSYQLVVQDASSFRRKQWYYLVLDEAHNIKNFKSQRWQTLLNFNTQRRLLLTGTPLQNNLMELWSLMHFLMPYIFRSRKEFSYWFNNPLTNMVEGNRGISGDILSRLHGIMRPFLLRRLKKDVAKQLPPKYEHVVMCKLSKRQAFLYEEFMSRSSTRSQMQGGNYLGMMNVLMQLRKVCNHPDLFEPRPIVSPFCGETFIYRISTFVAQCCEPINCAKLYVNHPDSRKGASVMSLWAFDLDTPSREKIEDSIFLDDYNLQGDVDDGVGLIGQDDLMMQTPRYRNFITDVIARQSAQRRCRISSCTTISHNRSRMKNFIDFSWRHVAVCKLRPRFLERVAMYKVAGSDYGRKSLGSREKRLHHRYGLDISPSWLNLVFSLHERASSMLDLIKEFVFVLPPVSSRGPQQLLTLYSSRAESNQKKLSEAIAKNKNRIDACMAPFYPSYIRQKIFFPDRKLVQFDSGKLQALYVLLDRLKKGGHKCLIFTQMSKMLDVLEVFLNLHSHTYVRLDGSTGVEKRQRLMDRFNTDPKIFAFILSTRSGGLGINLTGADSVIFYDSDWNPAMDAQAQDRAHRIGQTREVHIYRMVCKSTVEENILTKAKQKRHLDFLVMSEGDFNVGSIFSSSGIQDLLQQSDNAGSSSSDNSVTSKGLDTEEIEDIEKVMAMVEDEEDVSATKGAKEEAALEQAEFDESKTSGEGQDQGDEAVTSFEGEEASTKERAKKSKVSKVGSGDAVEIKEEEKAEEEFATWQASVGGSDFHKLEAALRPIERFALRFHIDVDPYYSVHYLTEQQRLLEMEEDARGTEWDIEAIEQQKQEEEDAALAQGELIAVNLTRREISRVKSEYLEKKSQINKQRKLRELTGEGWQHLVDPVTGSPFWYNEDTGEATYGKPSVIRSQEVMLLAKRRGYSACPHEILVKIFEHLLPYPDRTSCSSVCASWCKAERDPIFHKLVLSIEMGADDKCLDDKICTRSSDRKSSEQKRNRNVYSSLSSALSASVLGDTISLGFGHHIDKGVMVSHAVRIVGAENEPEKVVVELSGGLHVNPSARRVVLSGITLQRSRLCSIPSSLVSVKSAVLEMLSCRLNNDGGNGSCLWGSLGASVRLKDCSIRGGQRAGATMQDSELCAFYCKISHNPGKGLSLFRSICYLEDSYLSYNLHGAVSLAFGSKAALQYCDVRKNGETAFLFDVDGEDDNCLHNRHCSGDEKVSAEWFTNNRRKWFDEIESQDDSENISAQQLDCDRSHMPLSFAGNGNGVDDCNPQHYDTDLPRNVCFKVDGLGKSEPGSSPQPCYNGLGAHCN